MIAIGIVPHEPLVPEPHKENREDVHDEAPHGHLESTEFESFLPRPN